ncbi:MAG: response regulator [Verrucomicrobiota bacterium]
MHDILIVEDDEQIRRALTRALAAEGYTVASASNGKEALENLERGAAAPKVIIMDLMMPVMDGWRFRKKLLSQPQWADVPVIVLSGFGCDETEGGELPSVHYVTKPVSLRSLFDSIARLIAAAPAARLN